ncbi:hypothetical protein ACFVUB_34100 [Streptomyces niveus]|uniref:hypothetical protein n=1 Tax=Streptomyces niveus TaxID=193462 RepID=UPI0036DA73DD
MADQVLTAGAGAGWTDLLAGVAVLNAPFCLRTFHGLLATVVITVSCTAGVPDLREAPVVLVLQGILSAGMFILMRRAADSAPTPSPRP